MVPCERGIRTFETATRNTLDLSAIPVLRDRTELPVIVDPSHAAGRASLVPPLAIAAVAAGTDGLLIESHPHAEDAWCDSAQAISLEVLAEVVRVTELLVALARPSPASTIRECRDAIDGVDAALARLLERRAMLVARVERTKLDSGVPIRDQGRETEVMQRVVRLAPHLGQAGATAVMSAVIDVCRDSACGSLTWTGWRRCGTSPLTLTMSPGSRGWGARGGWHQRAFGVLQRRDATGEMPSAGQRRGDDVSRARGR